MKEIIKEISKNKNVSKGKMFGWDCMKINGNVFMTITPKNIVLKLDKEEILNALKIKGPGG